MKGNRKLFSILTALALCLALLPGTARAADAGGPGVSISGESLVSGKQYVADGSGVVEKTETTPADTPYLDYNNGVLTVYGQMDLKTCYFRITGNVTFTGGEDSCLETDQTYLDKSTLTLSGSVDFKPRLLSGNTSASPANKLTTTAGYSGDIAIQDNPSSSYVLLDVQSSASISIMGVVNYSYNIPTAPMTLKSAGDISLKSLLEYPTVTIKGKNVSLTGGPAFRGNFLTITAEQDVTIESGTLAIMGAAEVSAGGNVTISSGSTLVSANSTNSLTVKNAQSVSIQGKTDATNEYIAQLLTVPVTFENCGNVTVTDTGTGEILKEGVAVTSNCPWTATTGGKTVTIPSGSWTYGGNISSTLNATTGTYVINSANPIVYNAGEGKIFYKPAAEGTPAVLTLDGASLAETLQISPVSPVQMELKGNNQSKEIYTGPLTLTGTGSFAGTLLASEFTNNSTGTLNAVVGVFGQGDIHSYTVYGERSTSDSAFNVSTSVPLTIAEGAVLTVDAANRFTINGPAGLTNNGTIINNAGITINADQDAADEDISAFIKSLKLTGTGNLSVKKGSGTAETYTNSGLKLLPPAGTDGKLDLSSKTTGEDKLTTEGYKWEVLETDINSGAITSAALTLAPGFNAAELELPNTGAIQIVTQGEASVKTLALDNPTVELTLSGNGPLTITDHVEISGAENSLTVDAGAKVVAYNGISIGASGGVDSTVTVNGTLTVAQGSGSAAIYGGKVAVGTTGILEVSGEKGVELHGVGGNFSDLFTVTGNGRFTANCSDYNVRVQSSGSFPAGTTAAGAINLGPEYMPDGCEARLDGTQIKLVRISDGQELIGHLTIHKNHTWSSDWTADGDIGHYHACTFEGCAAKNDERPHFYAHGANACRDCNHARPANTPDSDSSEEGGDSFAGFFGGGNFGGGGSGVSGYTVTVEKASHGEVASSRRTAFQGDTVTLAVTPDSGYMLDTLTVTDSLGNEIEPTEKGGGEYTFPMPGRDVTVRASFISSACTGGADCPSRAFSDLDTGKWYHEAVDYVLQNGLMSGYGSGLFGPNDTLSRAQFAQIIYNREGRPAATGGNAFLDVASNAWYAPAAAWAAANGIVSGYGDGRFGPNDNITREQLAVMLWRYAGSPAAVDRELRFADADKAGGWALEALRWAAEQGLAGGKGGGALDPKGNATRAETAAMLMRYVFLQQ